MEIFIAVVLVVLAVVAIFIYNRLVSLRQRVRQAFADIDAQLRARTDLIPNLVSTVKGYAAHESETLKELTDARAMSANAGNNVGAAAAADSMLSGTLGRLFAVAEAYPDLKANTNFLQLQEELSDLENKLAASRRFFNSVVGEYNSSIEQFPAVLFSGIFGFKHETFFGLTESQRQAEERAPSVSF